MKYASITIFTTKENVEKVADLMWTVSDGGVEVFDAEDLNVTLKDFSWDYLDEPLKNESNGVPYARCVVDASSAKDSLEKLLNICAKNSIKIDISDTDISFFDEQDWENSWKNNYQKVVEGKFSIVPIWDKTDSDNEKTVYINPASGFGTGQHESTAIALSLMNDIDFANKKVFDLGTGSGILGLASSKFGACYVRLSDYDPEAINNARENVLLNNAENSTDCVVEDAFTAKFDNDYDVILANLTADILMKLTEKLYASLKNNGDLIVSGILTNRLDSLVSSFEAVEFKTKKCEKRGEWVGVVFVKDGH